ncbi:MAG: glycosyltransferase family A protein, partial [Polyangiaceae bacterium]
MELSVVIPTCNRRDELLSLLRDLSRSTHLPQEILIVDSSDQEATTVGSTDFVQFPSLAIHYIRSPVQSVCVQRNIGIREAKGSWVFLCDDDIEVPPNYLARIIEHINTHPRAGALSGLVLEQDGGDWRSRWPVDSSFELLWSYAFQLSIWGEIVVRGPMIDWIANRYRRRGNHISRAGWPVIVDFSGSFFRTPVYGLGA